MTVKFLRLPQVCERLGISKSQVWKLAQRGALPRPVKLTQYTTAWIESEIDEYMRELITRRDEVSASHAAAATQKP